MADVFFKLLPDFADVRLNALVARIVALEGVVAAGPLHPQSPRMKRSWFARLNETGDPERIVRELTAMPEVESASTPARRGLPSS
jgi:hypothetical protein